MPPLLPTLPHRRPATRNSSYRTAIPDDPPPSPLLSPFYVISSLL